MPPFRVRLALQNINPHRPPIPRLPLDLFALFLLFNFEQKSSVDVRQNTSEGDRCSDECIQLFIATDCQLQVTRRYAFDFEIFCRVASQL